MKKYKFYINNLDCAMCAKKVEEGLNKYDYLNDVVVNFNTSRISFSSDNNITVEKLNSLVKKIEPDAYVTDSIVTSSREYHLFILVIGIVFAILACFINIKAIRYVLYLISYILLLYRPFINTIKSKSLNENALITISCIGAFLIGEFMEGVMVVSLYLIGKMLEEKAINRSKKSIEDLMNLKELNAYVKKDNKIVSVSVEDIKVGDIIVVKKGEKIPVDGVVIKGSTNLDTSMLTGESEKKFVTINDEVLSGCINDGDIVHIKALKPYSESVVSQILDLLLSATDKKTKTETVVSKISKVYTPIIIILALVILFTFPLVFNITYKNSIYRALTFLVVSCPCAIAISVPLSYFAGIGIASKNGILIKGSNYLDNLSKVNNIIFDKTGTLTNGIFKVKSINIYDKKYTKEAVIDILVSGEEGSNHPIAKSIMKLKNEKTRILDITDYKEINGFGILFKINNDNICIGNKCLYDCKHNAYIHLSINDKHIASIHIDDGIKEGAFDTIKYLKKNNIKPIMFTGDKKDVAISVGKKLEIEDIRYEMLPTDKFNSYDEIMESGITAFVGDGVNDAPVLKRALVGISMGGMGSQSAIEASDIVLMNDDLNKIPLAIKISKYTNKIIKYNLIFALTVKLFVLILSILGLSSMWMAVFADTGVTLLTILNSLRIIFKFN